MGERPMLDNLSDEKLLEAYRKYQERFKRTASSGKSPEGSDIFQILNADVVFWECRKRGLVDEDGNEVKK